MAIIIDKNSEIEKELLILTRALEIKDKTDQQQRKEMEDMLHNKDE